MPIRRTLLLFALLVLSIAGGAVAQEAITLTTPLTAKPAIAGYTPGDLTIALLPDPRIRVSLVATDGTVEVFAYPCAVGVCTTDTPAKVVTLITTLNTANLVTRSLWRRVFDRLCVDFPARFPNGCTVQ